MQRMLSIVVPCLNEAAAIAETLETLAPMRARGAEVIVVDGGSRDGTPERAAALADRVIEAPRGRALQMNAGAAEARGEIFLFLHADTLLPEGADTLVVDGLARSRRGWGRFDVEIRGRHPLLRVVGALINLRSRLTGIATGDQAIFVTRSLFTAAGGFPEIPLMEDVELSKRLKRFGPPLCLRHRARTSGRRWEEHGVLRTILLMWALRLAYWAGADPARLARCYYGERRRGLGKEEELA
jgi:rSAM/selenodomain-associated transferase 2